MTGVVAGGWKWEHDLGHRTRKRRRQLEDPGVRGDLESEMGGREQGDVLSVNRVGRCWLDFRCAQQWV